MSLAALVILQGTLLAMVILAGCKKSEDVKVTTPKPEKEIFDAAIDPQSGQRSIRIPVVHLYQDTVYLLNQGFTREAGEQLIIEPGTLIKAKATRDAQGIGGIVINAGGLITASGNADAPIVFTSVQQDATQGASWEGIVIHGKSFNNSRGTTGVAADFSGVLKYVRIEFAPLVFESVGNKTIVENVMVSYTNRASFDQYQSSFSFYGGTFNARNLVSYACGGPSDFFITNGYAGNMQNIIACRHPFFGKTGSEPANSLCGIFIQNNAGNASATPYTNPVISNMTVLGPNAQNGSPLAFNDTSARSGAIVTTNSACFQIRNSVFAGYPAAGWFVDDKPVADNLQARLIVDFNYSIVQSNMPNRVFYIAPGVAGSYTPADFKAYMTGPFFKNRAFVSAADFMFTNIADYDLGPNLLPAAGSPLLQGASFDNSTYFSNDFFNKTIKYTGALGVENWTKGWTNFAPLKTNYNFPG